MTIDRTKIHELLDGDLPAGERERVLKKVQGEPALRKELDGLMAAADLLEQGRVQPPPGFTRAVMDRLPRRPAPLAARVRAFLFGGRVLRWNVATALGLAVVAAVTIIMMKQMTRPGGAGGPAGDTAVVRLTFIAPAAERVAVAGDFNKWRTSTHIMKRENGMWSIELPLRPGRYSYMFIVDGSMWVTDPHADAYSNDGFGNRNAVMQVTL